MNECYLWDNKCFSDQSLIIISNFVDIIPKNGFDEDLILDIINKAKEMTKCDTQACIANNKKLKQMSIEKYKKDVFEIDIETRFNPRGQITPGSTTNVELDGFLKRLGAKYPFFKALTFSMMDFNKVNWPIANINLPSDLKAFSCIGGILNTDVSSGLGKHWVAYFIDDRNKEDTPSFEYFNSSGNPPTKELSIWLISMEKSLEKKIQFKLSRIRHQYRSKECGIYCLYFITQRLKNYTFEQINRERITDYEMENFRKKIFR